MTKETEETEGGATYEPATDNDPFAPVVDSMPEPTPGVAEREEQKLDDADAKQAEAASKYADGDGTPFDPQLHVTDSDGNPVLTSKGKCRKRPGRKSGNGGSRPQSVLNAGKDKGGGSAPAQPEQSQDELNKAKARESGKLAGNVTINMLVMMGGEEFNPRDEKAAGYDERQLMQSAFADYFEAKGYTDFPPGIALTAVMFAYIAPRFQMPKTQSRMAKAVGWFRKKRDEKKREQAKQERKEGKRDWRGRPVETSDKDKK